MADQQCPQVLIGGIIRSSSSSYLVQNVLGTGTFGVVAQCYNFSSRESVALKIIKDKENVELAEMEANILLKLKAHNSDKFNIVSLNNSFSYNGHFCLEFELLGENLYEYLQTQEALELQQIRPIMHQMATALQFLKSVGVVHADLKPENILMVNHEGESLKVKLSDFGLAHDDPEAWVGKPLQTLYYMAPEVLVGAPFHEAIDVWSLGCVGAELLMGDLLFAGLDFYDMMRHQVEIVGAPPEHILDVGLHTTNYFIKQRGAPWRFMSPSEAGVSCGSPKTINHLRDLLTVSPEVSCVDSRHQRDVQDFVWLLALMLDEDAGQRITPSDILKHPFLSMPEFGSSSMREEPAPKMSIKLQKSLLRNLNGPSSVTCVNAGHNMRKATFGKVEKDVTPVLTTCPPIPITCPPIPPTTCVDPGHNMSELAADVQEEHPPIPPTNMEMPEQTPPEPSAENPQREASPSISGGDGTASSSVTQVKVEDIDANMTADPPIPPTKTKKTKFQKFLSGLKWIKQLFKRRGRRGGTTASGQQRTCLP